MGMDPITLAAAASVTSSLIGGYGQAKAQSAAQRRFDAAQRQGQSMMKTGQDPYELNLQRLLQGQADPTQLSLNAGNIDTGSILGNFNSGQDALAQFLRADPANQQSFDASQSFNLLDALDQRNQNTAVGALNSNFGSLGSRFGSGAQRQTSDLLANINAQTGARNAGILQSSFENQANRRLQGLGLQLQGAQGIAQQGNAMAQLAAQLGIANQGNQQFNTTFNQSARQQAFQNQFSGIQAGFGMQNANDAFNAQLFSIMQGLAAPQGNAYTAIGQTGGDISQMLMFLPFLKQLGQPAPTTPKV
jgi:hypothetical protein